MKQILILLAVIALYYVGYQVLVVPRTYETRTFIIERDEHKSHLLSQDGNPLTLDETEWVNESTATNIGTAIDIMHNPHCYILEVTQAYNMTGGKCSEGSTSNLR